MNTNQIIGVVVGLVVVGGGVYMLSNQKASSISETTSTPTTLKALMAAGVAQKCDFVEDSQEGGQVSGTVYVGGGKVRADYVHKGEGSPATGHMINDKTMMYVWGDSMPSGIKMAVSASAQSNVSNPSNTTIDTDKAMDYHCSPWSVDAGVFTVPSGITFNDMSTMIQNAMQGQTGVKK